MVMGRQALPGSGNAKETWEKKGSQKASTVAQINHQFYARVLRNVLIYLFTYLGKLGSGNMGCDNVLFTKGMHFLFLLPKAIVSEEIHITHLEKGWCQFPEYFQKLE